MIRSHHRSQASPRLQEAHRQEQAFLERARSGEDIRNDALLYLQQPLYSLARRIHWRYSQQQGNVVEVPDLVQSASVEILASFTTALTKEEPFPYLFRLAYFTMIDCVNNRGRLVKTHPEKENVIILSLDKPLAPDGTLLADILPGKPPTQTKPLVLCHAIETLPEKQRIVIQRYFGLAGNTPESFRQMSKVLSPQSSQPHPNKAYRYYKLALAALRQKLSLSSPQQSCEAISV